MIKIEEQTIKVESGINGKGAIALQAKYNILSLRDSVNEVSIGDNSSIAVRCGNSSIKFNNK